MSSFISARVYLRVPPAFQIAVRKKSLEIQKHVNRAVGRICLQPMADVIVMHRQFSKDLFLARLQLAEEFLELGFVEEFTGAERKLHAAWPIATGELFDKAKFEELLSKLQTRQEQVFGELPVHYDNEIGRASCRERRC